MKEQNEKQAIEEMRELIHAEIKKAVDSGLITWTEFAQYLKERLTEQGYCKQEWISVEDRLPEVRKRVLLYSYHDGVNTGYRADDIGRFYVDKSYPYRPTHWMPLPEPPKMKGGAE